MFKIILAILMIGISTAQADTLSITRKTPGTVIASSGFNTNYDQIEAVVNGHIDADNIEDDAVTALKLNPDVVRSGYGLIQHTDGSLYVDVSDTNPALELTDGGLRVKLDSVYFQRTSDGVSIQTGVFDLLGTSQTITAQKTFSSAIIASAGVTGNLTGNVTGNVTGNLTGNVTGNVTSSINDYGTSSSSSSTINSSAFKIAYGNVSVGNKSSTAITNLPFSSSTSYKCTANQVAGTLGLMVGPAAISYSSGSQVNIQNAADTTFTISWICVGS